MNVLVARCFVVLFVFLGVGVVGANSLMAQSYNPERFITEEQFQQYEDNLNALLKTRFDEEKLFIKMVVDQVEAGKLPTKLIQTTYGWVRNKRPNTKYPFVYFERVLRLQAKKVGIATEVPKFDYRIYRRIIR